VDKTGPLASFTQFHPTGFTQWVKLTMPTLEQNLAYVNPALIHDKQHYVCSENCKL